MAEDTALNPVLNPPSHKPLSHLADPEMLLYIDSITRFFHALGANANTKEQVNAMTQIKLRVEWLQTRLGIFEGALNTRELNGVELGRMLTSIPPAKNSNIHHVEMFIVQQPTVATPYVRRFINFDWIEFYLASNRNVTPKDAYEVALKEVQKLVFTQGKPPGVVIRLEEGCRNPEIIIERTQSVRI